MKVYIIGPAHPFRGGLADFDMRMARGFQEKGCEVHLINFSLQYPSFLFPGKTQYTDGPAPSDLTIRQLINSVNPLNWLKVGRQLRKEKPDLIIVRYWLPFMGPAFGTILRQVRKNGHTRIIAIADNIIPHEKRFGDTLFTKYFVKPVDKFVCMSKDVAADVKVFSTRPVLTLPHPMYDIYGELLDKAVSKLELGLRADDKVVLFFGLIRKYKGLDILLNAFADKRVRDRNIKLVIAGEFYAGAEEYEKQISDLQLETSIVRATHFIPNEEVNKYFSAADVVVQPYKNATQSGITQIGFHFSKPMIVTNVGGLPEFIRHNELGLVAEVDAPSVAAAIVRYFDEALEATFTAAMEVEKKQYEWTWFIEKLLVYAGS